MTRATEVEATPEGAAVTVELTAHRQAGEASEVVLTGSAHFIIPS